MSNDASSDTATPRFWAARFLGFVAVMLLDLAAWIHPTAVGWEEA